MKQTHQIAYNYAMACKKQEAAEQQINQAFASLGADNQIFDLAGPLKEAYTDLVARTIGPELSDWLSWWMYETEYGSENMEFIINGVKYNPQDMTLYRFLELVDASN